MKATSHYNILELIPLIPRLRDHTIRLTRILFWPVSSVPKYASILS